jgi:hypothetical protein
MLDRAIAESQAAQQSAKAQTKQQAHGPQIDDEEKQLEDDRAILLGESHVAEVLNSEEQANADERRREEDSGAAGANPENKSPSPSREENGA